MVIKCAKCKTKIIKYNKIGKGKILKFIKSRILKWYIVIPEEEIRCTCGEVIAVDKGNHYATNLKSFTSHGKVN